MRNALGWLVYIVDIIIDEEVLESESKSSISMQWSRFLAAKRAVEAMDERLYAEIAAAEGGLY